jgi:hypothetical protein
VREELAEQLRVASNWRSSYSASFLSAEIRGMHHFAQLRRKIFNNILIVLYLLPSIMSYVLSGYFLFCSN